MTRLALWFIFSPLSVTVRLAEVAGTGTTQPPPMAVVQQRVTSAPLTYTVRPAIPSPTSYWLFELRS